MKKNLLFAAMLAVAGCMSFTACSDDDDNQKKVIIDPNAGGNKLTLEYTCELTLGESYEGTPVYIELDKIAQFFSFADTAALVTAMQNNDVSMFGMNSNGEVNAEKGATSTNGIWGHWCDATGSPTSWGDDAYVYAEFTIPEDGSAPYFGCGQYPDHITETSTISVTEGLAVDVDTVFVKINFVISPDEYVDPETAPEGDPASAEYTVTINKEYDSEYTRAEVEGVQDALRNAFKMTTYQLFQAYKNDEIAAYVNVKADTIPSYSADAPGYWMTSTGEIGEYNGGCFWFSLYFDKTTIVMGGGNHPEWTTGANANFDFIIACKGVTVTYHVTYNLAEKPSIEATKVADYELSAKFAADTASYDGVTIDFDEAVAKTALGCDSLGAVMSLKANGAITNTYTANNGFWYNAQGQVDSYNNSCLFIEYNAEKPGKLSVGQFPNKLKAGESYSVQIGFLNPAADKYVLYTVKVSIE